MADVGKGSYRYRRVEARGSHCLLRRPGAVLTERQVVVMLIRVDLSSQPVRCRDIVSENDYYYISNLPGVSGLPSPGGDVHQRTIPFEGRTGEYGQNY